MALASLPLLATQEQLSAVRAFFADAGAGSAVPEPLKLRLTQRLEAEAAWRLQHEAKLCAALKANP